MVPFVLLALSLIATRATAPHYAFIVPQDVSRNNHTSTLLLNRLGPQKRGDPSETGTSDLTLDELASTCSAPSITGEQVYNDAVPLGRRLAFAGVAESRALRNYLGNQATSPWDGELREELRTWGWVEDERPYKCDFRDPGPGHLDALGLEKAFADLEDVRGIQGLDPRPSNAGGRTVCHYIYHSNSPIVIDKPADGQPWPTVSARKTKTR